MRDRNIRHVPIFQTENGRHHILGIVTLKKLAMENLLSDDVPTKESHTSAPSALAVLAADRRIEPLLRSVFPRPATRIERLSYLSLDSSEIIETALKPYEALIFDLDDVSEKAWTSILSALNSRAKPTPVSLTLSQFRHKRQVLDIIRKLAGAPWLRVFQKPIDLVTLRMELSRFHSQKGSE